MVLTSYNVPFPKRGHPDHKQVQRLKETEGGELEGDSRVKFKYLEKAS